MVSYIGRRSSGSADEIPPQSRENTAMNIQLNGEARQLQAPLTLHQLLQAEGLGERRVAVEVNGEIIPRSQHAEYALQEGDVVEIVHALGGG